MELGSTVVGQRPVLLDRQSVTVALDGPKLCRLPDVQVHAGLAGLEVDGAEPAAETAGMQDTSGVVLRIARSLDDDLSVEQHVITVADVLYPVCAKTEVNHNHRPSPPAPGQPPHPA